MCLKLTNETKILKNEKRKREGTRALEDRKMVKKKGRERVCTGRQKNGEKKKLHACGNERQREENNNIYNNKRHACGVCEWVDENNNIINNKRHACGACEWMDGMYIFIYIYIYYNDSRVSVMVLVFGKYESGRINYV